MFIFKNVFNKRVAVSGSFFMIFVLLWHLSKLTPDKVVTFYRGNWTRSVLKERKIELSKTFKQKIPINIRENDSMSITNDTGLPWWDKLDLKDCSNADQTRESLPSNYNKRYNYTVNYTVNNHCGNRAAAYGQRQKVLSYTLFNIGRPPYESGIHQLLEDSLVFYPGWVVRLYTDPRERYKLLCPLLRQYPHFAVCDVTNLPPPLGDISNNGCTKTLWRITPMGDPTVEYFCSRDTDSKLNSREVAAVDQWMKSGKLMHMMRDYIFHNQLIMGGMYGVYQPEDLIENLDAVRVKVCGAPASNLTDQRIMAARIPKWLTDNSMQHDSYRCQRFTASIPFPTKREGLFYIGGRHTRSYVAAITNECPTKCRPVEHQDWVYC